MLNLISKFIRNDSGAAAVEYGILVALIAAVIITVVATVGQDVLQGFKTVCTALEGNAATTTGGSCGAAAP